jgi:pimeloyl-ACP methyl ester carboxylesterase
VCIEDAGHLANLERPDEFNRAIAAFLEDNDNG